MASDLEAAWDAVHAALPPGWYVGRPSYHDERDERLLYAFDPSERAVVGIRSREWTAATEAEAAAQLGLAASALPQSRMPQSKD